MKIEFSTYYFISTIIFAHIIELSFLGVPFFVVLLHIVILTLKTLIVERETSVKFSMQALLVF